MNIYIVVIMNTVLMENLGISLISIICINLICFDFIQYNISLNVKYLNFLFPILASLRWVSDTPGLNYVINHVNLGRGVT